QLQTGIAASYTSFVAQRLSSTPFTPIPSPTPKPGQTLTTTPTSGTSSSSTPTPTQTAIVVAGGNITVDYTSPIQSLSPLAVGMDETGYGYPSVLANDAVEQQRVGALHLGYMRMDLKYTTSGNPSSTIVCGGSGCDTRWTGDQWIQAIQAAGAEPVVIVETGQTAADAANMVRHFNVGTSTPNYVKYWLVGNEPDLNGMSSQTYSSDFNQFNDAMKAVDSTIKVGGGTTAWYDSGFLATFLQLSGSRVDFVDFHGYPQQGTVAGNYTTLFQAATGYGQDVQALRSLIEANVPSRASQIAIEVGEWELNWGGSAQDDINFHS